MTLDQLRTFLWVSRLGGVRKAALEMNISQPAVSGRIVSLEESLGTILFDRAERGVKLTKNGVLLREYAEQIIDLIETIRSNVVSAESVDRLLRIGVVETIVQLWLPLFLTQLTTKYPNIKVELVVDITVNLRQQLLDRSLDFAVLMGPISDFAIENIELPNVELAWFKAAWKKDMDFQSTPVITYNRQSRPYRDLSRMMSDRYGNSFTLFPSSSIHAGLEMVASGIGVGLFPRQIGMKLSQQGRIVEFDPGWTLAPLKLTASFVDVPRNELCSQVSKIARTAATDYNSSG